MTELWIYVGAESRDYTRFCRGLERLLITRIYDYDPIPETGSVAIVFTITEKSSYEDFIRYLYRIRRDDWVEVEFNFYPGVETAHHDKLHGVFQCRQAIIPFIRILPVDLVRRLVPFLI